MRYIQRVAMATLMAGILGACGGNDDRTAQSAAGEVGDSLPGAPVGSFKPAADSALATGNAINDHLQKKGATPMSGIQAGAAEAARASAQDTVADSVRPRIRSVRQPDSAWSAPTQGQPRQSPPRP